MAYALLRAEAVLRFERAVLSTYPMEFPAPTFEAPPSLAHVSKPDTFRHLKQTWISDAQRIELPFKENLCRAEQI